VGVPTVGVPSPSQKKIKKFLENKKTTYRGGDIKTTFKK
jgi:hypothetical protein